MQEDKGIKINPWEVIVILPQLQFTGVFMEKKKKDKGI